MASASPLAVEEAIVHEVPNRPLGREGGGPTLSDIPSDLDDDLRRYFSEKISRTLRTTSYPVVYDPSAGSPVPQLLLDYFQDAHSFVRVSRDIGAHLYSSQTGVNSPGLLTLLAGRLGHRSCVAVMKLEKEEGVRVRRLTRQGQTTFDIEHLRELMLTEGTRVFKVGLFPQFTTIGRMRGDVSDNQRGFAPKSEVADFFLRRFLGCRLREAPDVLTKRFLEAFEIFVNEDVHEPERQARYEIAVLAELGSEAGDINPTEFARRNIVPRERDGFLQRLRELNAPTQSFDKDLTLIESRVRQMVLAFESGIRVSGPRESFHDSVTVERLEQDTAEVRIRGILRRIASR